MLRYAAPLAVFALAAGLGAQPYGTDMITTHVSGLILRTSQGGVTTTIGSGLGNGGLFNMVAVDNDNRYLIVLDTINRSPATNQVLRVDPARGAVVSVVWRGAPLSLVQSWLEVDQDGDYVVADGAGTGNGGLLKIRHDGSGLKSLYAAPGLYPFCFTEDPITGDWVIGDLTTRRLLQVSRSGGTVVTAVALPPSQGRTPVPTGMVADPVLNDIWVSAGPPGIFGWDPVTLSLRTLASVRGLAPNAMTVDRAPAQDGSLIYTGNARPTPGEIWAFDRNGNVTKTFARVGMSVLGMVFEKSRNLAPRKLGDPNRRIIRVSFPGDAGKGYVAAFSLAGGKPGFALPDGRVVPLIPDLLTLVTLQGPLPPFILGNVGTLDPRGEAVVGFDLSALGSAVSGLKVWVSAVSLDPQAPSGVSQVAGRPLLFVLD